ncbi:1-acyl-sn-glycerol-3-phosphate acyltransferase [Pseudomonas sp. Fig-3]|jgi:1-acyl-sn-glycerol-3-phosphate acyltransferase|uniref:1-acyl-sn-glycerol-3-phosphate acyltransferase n=1 Tax=Pseudomonas rhizophila TaxID=2045200 RepID=A0ABM6U984_9PSED|nr:MULTISPECIES: lysophospholipid acyltransferase family protein [Pseudomonas]AVU73928.1 1-acyl-sn-glycerol-3-phosphate acyltransferase [Pseudomonas rhizophila]MBD0705848.1 1-acyl-sn-glycerol-3-phosphate acyltransferase [Pseudomonas sp. PSB1]MDD2031855.1 1-acyl-sn-glycerol-3-phosphate acyltransferase [Pseudomonas sp. 39167]MDR8387896.1 1-acyl-sn-glycerol-3-phosphate acyltransferase [Pseudomonas sp. JL2]MEA1029038.1 lysophospholipid acyltransferase family protein [Pseudomonas sp. N-137]
MDLATQPVNGKHRDAYYWRLIATAASFVLFGLGGLCLRLLVFPLLAWLPGDAQAHRLRARRTVGRLFWFFIRFMARTGVLTYQIDGAEKLGRPGQMIIANHPSLIDVVFLIGLVRDANCVVKQSLWENPFTRGPLRSTQYISNDGSMDMLDAASDALQDGQSLIVFPEGTRTRPGQPPAFHRGAAAIALRGAKILTPVTIKVSPTTLTKAEPWYRIPQRRVHFSFHVGADIDPQAFAALGPAPQASRRLNDFLHHYYIKELAEDERSAP